MEKLIRFERPCGLRDACVIQALMQEEQIGTSVFLINSYGISLALQYASLLHIRSILQKIWIATLRWQ
jgi:hypothetical protein